MPQINDKATRDVRRKQAVSRAVSSDALTAQQRLDTLDARLGEGVGAKRERARLAALLKKA